jgi:TM2 domain-containing membrane protein YozV
MNTTTETESTSKSYVTALLLVLLGFMTSLIGASLFYSGKKVWGVLITVLMYLAILYRIHFTTLAGKSFIAIERTINERCADFSNGLFWFSLVFAFLSPFVVVYKHNNKES